jgi:hypothetical protein
VTENFALADSKPKPKVFREKIGHREYELREEKIDVFEELVLWPENPRLMPYLAQHGGAVDSEEQLENYLKTTGGYAGLEKSISDIGQMEPVYVWRRNDSAKFLAVEGNTRVTIHRELERKNKGKPTEGNFRRITAKVLPPEFTEEERAILLAKIHVAGTGVRGWTRYVDARFVHETVEGKNGGKPLMTVSQLAEYMGKSISWVSRLKNAYDFAQKFVDHVDAPEAQRIAAKEFSTLEEISKAPSLGSMLRDYGNKEYDELRGDVFDMVRRNVFKEYRDARFLKEFHDDPEKWAVLKTGEEHAANRFANEIQAGNSNLKARIEAISASIRRSLERDPSSLADDDVDRLRDAVKVADSYINAGVSPFRLELARFTTALESVSLADIRAVAPGDMERFEEALGDFRERLEKHKTWKAA